MKKYLLAGLVLLFFCVYTNAQKTKFYKIPSQENKVFHQIFEGKNKNSSEYITASKDSNFIWVNSKFEVSKLVTLYEYKVFLEAIKQDSGKQLFLAHLPDSNMCTPSTYNKYINSSKYHKSPVVGITWEQAQNYCYWKSLQEQKNGKFTYIYRLPSYPEWLAAYSYLKEQKKAHDFNHYFSDWTLSPRYTNMLSFLSSSDKGEFPHFLPKPSDPAAWRRFVAIGNSYQRKLGELAQFFGFNYLNNNGFADISFRLIKTPINKMRAIDVALLKHWKTYGMHTSPSTFKRYHNKKKIHPLTIDPINTKKDTNLVVHLYETDISQVYYQTKNGRFHGGFEARVIEPPYNYMIKGQFNNNQRVGAWNMIDVLGGTTERFYYNNFSYIEFRSAVKEPTANYFLETPKQLLKRNAKGYFDYHFIHEMNVFMEKLAIHLLSPPNNAALFDAKIGLFKKLYTQVQTKQIDAYTNSVLDTVFKASTLTLKIPSNYELIGYKMKEVSFFDTHRFIKESRILSLCPLVVDKENPTDTIELFWLYYPSIRELLTTIKTSSPNNPYIEHVDDLFFFQDFDAQLFSEVSYSGQKTTPSKTRAKETERFKLDWLQLEHDCWQYFAWPSDN